MKKLTWTNDRNQKHVGFWLPVGRTYVTEVTPPFGPNDDQFAVWMEEDFAPDDDDRRQFLGSIRLGLLSMHISAYPLVEDPVGGWRCENAAADDFLAAYEDRPLDFAVTGYAGRWILIAHPFC